MARAAGINIENLEEHLEGKSKALHYYYMNHEEEKAKRKAKARLEKEMYPERQRFRSRKYYEENKDKTKWRHIFKTYGLTKEEYMAIAESQDFRCAICKRSLDELNGKNVHMDHCHSTGRVRGILCSACNKGIGLFGDDTNLLESAIKYLKAYSDG